MSSTTKVPSGRAEKLHTPAMVIADADASKTQAQPAFPESTPEKPSGAQTGHGLDFMGSQA